MAAGAVVSSEGLTGLKIHVQSDSLIHGKLVLVVGWGLSSSHVGLPSGLLGHPPGMVAGLHPHPHPHRSCSVMHDLVLDVTFVTSAGPVGH